MACNDVRTLCNREGIDYEIAENGCWVWIKGKNAAGYAWGHAHRKYWVAVNGPIPEGFHVHHICRNTSCVNPDHLEPREGRRHIAEHRQEDSHVTLRLRTWRGRLLCRDFGRPRTMTKHRVDIETGSWIWTGSQTEAGYPTGYAHRKYWEEVNGPRPDGHHIHHVCRNTLCVNPAHLEAVDERQHVLLHQLERSGMTMDEVREVRRLATVQGVSAATVAKDFGISRSHVYWLWTERSWADMDSGIRDHMYPEPWPCERYDCDNLVTGHRHKRFCPSNCRGVTNARKRRLASSEEQK
jgi:hypothetical protein